MNRYKTYEQDLFQITAYEESLIFSVSYDEFYSWCKRNKFRARGTGPKFLNLSIPLWQVFCSKYFMVKVFKDLSIYQGKSILALCYEMKPIYSERLKNIIFWEKMQSKNSIQDYLVNKMEKI